MIKLLLVGLFVVFVVFILVIEGRAGVAAASILGKLFISGNKNSRLFVMSMEINRVNLFEGDIYVI